jgi:predicted amidohydrolase
MTSFTAAAIQTNVTMVDSTASASEIKRVRDQNLDRALLMLDWVLGHRMGPVMGVQSTPSLVGLPESFLHAFPRSDGARIENMRKVAIEIPGEETEKLAAKARKYNAYIFGASYELDPDWPDRYFNCGFIIDPAGEIALKYRKIQCGVIETGCSPHEVLDEYLERYGYDSLFPVLDTPIGRLGLLICADGLFGPEVARALAMKGAEILCFPISTTSPDHAYYHLVARARAIDNACYVLSPNLGQTFAEERCLSTGGDSVLVDFEGRILAAANTPTESTVQTLFHLDALRNYRLRTPYGVAGIRSEMYAPLYQRSHVPPNFFLEKPEQDLADERRLREITFQRMFDAGIYTPPAENAPIKKKPAAKRLEKADAK